MQDLTSAFLEFIRLASSDLPSDVEAALKNALEHEQYGSAAAGALDAILRNVSIAREQSTPLCQDTGTPLFYIRYPACYNPGDLAAQIRSAVADATVSNYLRPNAVHSVSGVNSGTNLGDSHFPTIHFREAGTPVLDAALILKGGGCENVGAQYSLPDSSINAGRDLDGVYRAALDAVFRAQGMGCAPGVLGIAIGGDRSSSYSASKEVLLRELGSTNPDPDLAALEDRILRDANKLSIGPMGFGGRTTLLGVHAAALYRLPASYFVSVSYMCWAYRRRRMIVSGSGITYP